LQARWPPASSFFSNSSFSIKTSIIFFPNLFPSKSASKIQKGGFAKNSIKFCRFISYLVRFWSKTMSKGLEKVDVFWLHHTHVDDRPTVQISHVEWNKARDAMSGTALLPTDANQNMLMAYQYLLHR
jgi:hypothetical protein